MTAETNFERYLNQLREVLDKYTTDDPFMERIASYPESAPLVPIRKDLNARGRELDAIKPNPASMGWAKFTDHLEKHRALCLDEIHWAGEMLAVTKKHEDAEGQTYCISLIAYMYASGWVDLATFKVMKRTAHRRKGTPK